MKTLLGIIAAVLLAGCGGSDDGQAGPSTQSVTIRDFKFGEPVQVSAGGSVEWVNEDSAPHNAVGDAFKTTDLREGGRDTVVFDKPGTYDYVCTFHPLMKGSVVVS